MDEDLATGASLLVEELENLAQKTNDINVPIEKQQCQICFLRYKTKRLCSISAIDKKLLQRIYSIFPNRKFEENHYICWKDLNAIYTTSVQNLV